MRNQGGSYRKESDGSITQVKAPTGPRPDPKPAKAGEAEAADTKPPSQSKSANRAKPASRRTNQPAAGGRDEES